MRTYPHVDLCFLVLALICTSCGTAPRLASDCEIYVIGSPPSEACVEKRGGLIFPVSCSKECRKNGAVDVAP